MTIEVRQAQEADRPAMAAFVAAQYAEYAPYKGADRFNWQYLRNPYSANISGGLPVWLALDGAKIVGQIAVQAGEISVRGELYRAGWMVDLIVDPAYRGQSIAQRLLHDTISGADIRMALTMAPAFRRMNEKEGAVTLGELPQFARLVRPSGESVRRYVMYRTRHRRQLRSVANVATGIFQAHRLLPLALNPVLALRDVSRGKSTKATTRIIEVKEFSQDVDSLWSRVKGEFIAAVPRVQQYLNWRFHHCPQLNYRLFEARQDGTLKGYLVLRKASAVELPVGIMVELFASRKDETTLMELARFGTEFFGNDVAAIQCVAAIPELQAVLRKLGYYKTGTMYPTALCSSPEVRAACEAHKDGFFFTAGDHDLDQIWIA